MPRVIISCLILVFVPAEAAAAPPNIILMMGDDHGWEETGYNGHPHVQTPVLDEMAAAGLRFDRFYSGHPNCSPTRASFLTGRHPNRMGTFAPGWSLRPEEVTLAHVAGQAGYRCAHFGKWHVGTVKAGSPVNPGGMGFHEWLSHDNFFELNPPLSRNGGPPEIHEGESSAILVSEAIAFIERSRQGESPFLAVIWFGSPHEPYSGLPDDLARYDDLPERYNDRQVRLTSNETGRPTERPQGDVLRERYAEITAMDRAIGDLRKHLREMGLRENTLLFYCGDNGTSGDSAVASPHRGHKSQIYEGGTLVPGLIEWPKEIPAPRATAFRASTSDLLPTIAAIIGEPLPDRPLDGISLLPAFDGTRSIRPEPLCFWMYDTSRFQGIRAEPYIDPAHQQGTTPLVKYLGGKRTRDFRNLHQPPIAEVDYRGARSIIAGDWKLIVSESRDGATQQALFDLGSDPAETSDLSEQQPERAAELASRLRQWQRSVLTSLQGTDYKTTDGRVSARSGPSGETASP